MGVTITVALAVLGVLDLWKLAEVLYGVVRLSSYVVSHDSTKAPERLWSLLFSWAHHRSKPTRWFADYVFRAPVLCLATGLVVLLGHPDRTLGLGASLLATLQCLLSISALLILSTVRSDSDADLRANAGLARRPSGDETDSQNQYVPSLFALGALVLCLAVSFGAVYWSLSQLNTGAFTLNSVRTRLGSFDAFYFSMTTLSTVGFGDISPATVPARAAVLVEIASGVLSLSTLVTAIFQLSRPRP